MDLADDDGCARTVNCLPALTPVTAQVAGSVPCASAGEPHASAIDSTTDTCVMREW